MPKKYERAIDTLKAEVVSLNDQLDRGAREGMLLERTHYLIAERRHHLDAIELLETKEVAAEEPEPISTSKALHVSIAANKVMVEGSTLVYAAKHQMVAVENVRKELKRRGYTCTQ